LKTTSKNNIPINVESITAEQKSKALSAMDRVKRLAHQTNVAQVVYIMYHPDGEMVFSETDKMVHVKG
jgi:hypothetical protein